MGQRLTLPGDNPGTRVIAGVKFVDGVAEPSRTISGPTLDYLTQIKGAALSDTDLLDTVTARPLEEQTIQEIRDFADTQEPPIKYKKSATHAELIETVQDELAERHNQIATGEAAHEATPDNTQE